MGNREVTGTFWAKSLQFAQVEHTRRSNALSRDLPAGIQELQHDVPQHSPRHTWLRGGRELLLT